MLQVFVLHSVLCEWTHFSCSVTANLYFPSFPVPPCIVTLSYIALRCPISSCVHLSYCSPHVLPCPDLLCPSWSALSHPIPFYSIPSYPVLPQFIPYILIHHTTHCLSYPDVLSRRNFVYLFHLGPLCQVLFMLVPSNTPNRLNWIERSLAFTHSKLSSPLTFLLHFISVLVSWETSF